MNRRNGYLMIQMIAVLAVLGVLLCVIGPLFRDVVRESIVTPRRATAMVVVDSLVGVMRADIGGADGVAVDGGRLVVEGERDITYEVFDYGVIREEGDDPNAVGYDRREFDLHDGQMRWQLVEDDGEAVGVELKHWVETKRSGGMMKLAESGHVLFLRRERVAKGSEVRL